jgi:preprotein translocase subunit YajC
MFGVAFAAAPSGAGGGGGGIGAFFPIIIMFVIFYFLLIRPQQKKQQDIRTMQQNLKKGDRVVFCGGMYGTVVKVKEAVVSIEIAEKVKVDVQRGAIGGIARGD